MKLTEKKFNNLALILLWLCLFTHPFDILAQGPLMSRKVVEDTSLGTRGPNLKKYSHMVVNLGFLCPHSNNNHVKFGLSNELGIGFRTKRKMGEHYALGMDFSYQFRNYSLKNLVNYPGVDSLNVTRERYVQRGFQLGLYQRFNFGKRGNFLGKYVDLVVWGELPFWNFHSYRFSSPESQKSFGKNGRIVLRNFDWDETFLYGVQIRIGINKSILYGNYRFSNLFTEGSGLPQLSPIVIGIQRGF